jgi:beta-lactam-binding protein with PASTA domain
LKRIFTLMLGALAMVAVALISAFIAMRLAIHGREVQVPQLTGLTVAEASAIAASDRLNLTLENRFYSTGIPAGRILAQDPAPGARVRRDWAVRITESLGAQAVNIPDLTGQSERAATVSIRRLALDLGVVAHLAIPGAPDVVLAQTPTANSGGVDSPRVSLLVSDPIGPSSAPSSSATTASAAPSSDDASSIAPTLEAVTVPTAYVMPSLLGLTWSAASARANAAGLHLLATTDSSANAPGSSLSTSQSLLSQSQPDLLALNSSAPRSANVVTAQTPQPGRRVLQGDTVHVTFGAAQ